MPWLHTFGYGKSSVAATDTPTATSMYSIILVIRNKYPECDLSNTWCTNT